MPLSTNSSSSSPQPPGYPSPSSSSIPRTSASESAILLTPNDSTTSRPSPRSSKPKLKHNNVFSNDGSFLERFQRNKMKEQENQKIKEELERKIIFEDRFKKRGKRKLPPPGDEDHDPVMNPTPRTSNTGSDVNTTQDDHAAKRPKTAEPLDQYQQQLRKYQGSQVGLSDSGTGVRPLAK